MSVLSRTLDNSCNASATVLLCRGVSLSCYRLFLSFASLAVPFGFARAPLHLRPATLGRDVLFDVDCAVSNANRSMHVTITTGGWAGGCALINQ